MKKLLILFLAAGLLSGCNNSPFASKESNTKNNDKEKDDKEKKDDRDDNRDDKKDDYTRKDDSKSSWTNSDRNKWMNQCEDIIRSNPQAKQLCSCVLEKVERKYQDYKEAEEASEADGERMAKECKESIAGGGDENTDDRYKSKDDGNDNYKEKTNTGGTWTNLQREQFIQGCATTARQAQGLNTQQANSYCDCMTRKVEKKYSFQEAARLTAADFQTQEWIDAATDCRAR